MTHRPYPRQQFESVAEAFAACAERFGTRRAVSCGSSGLTYAEVDRLSGSVAACLVSRGVSKGDLVGVVCEKRIEMPVVLLGILKAGAAYVPFDPSYPKNRLKIMAETAGIRWLAGRTPALDDLKVEVIDYQDFPKDLAFEPSEEITSESVAYVMFTSGSTGQPKGVAVPHRGILRLVLGQDYCRLGPDEVILQHSPVAFDASTFEIWGALLNGGELVVYPEEETSLRRLGAAIREHKITTLWLTAGLFHAMVDERPEDLRPLRQLLTGGDVVSPAHAAKLLRGAPDLTLINGYGPTENTTFTCCHTISLDEVEGGDPIPIGQPIAGTQVHILDEKLRPVKPGQPGELCAAGDGLALGYWGDRELTSEKFRPAPFGDFPMIYRTGDLARENEAGDFEFLGRIDQQVKIRGFRIELGEIETAINRVPGVQQCCVVAEASAEGADKTLIAHYVAGEEIPGDVFKAELAQSLPSHSIPAFYCRLDQLPLNPNGKVDRKALPRLREILSSKLGVSDPALRKETARVVAALLAEILELSAIPPRVNFFDLGASSLQIARLHEKLQEKLGREFPITDFFQFTTVEDLADHLDGSTTPALQHSSIPKLRPARRGGDIALVAMAGRFPGAADVETFWQNLLDGKEGISRFTAEELDFENARAPWADPNSEYVRARGIVEHSDLFDARHFGISPKEALEMDPQHRLLLECAQVALENAGCDPDRHEGKIGIFCGSSQNSYLLNNLCQDPDAAKKLAAGYPTANFNGILGNDKDFLPTRIAYKLNLRGPAISVQCACSTSLAAVAQACDSLRAGHCDMALAGGVSLGFPQKRDYLYTPDGIASRDGHCRTFDAGATGTVFGEGVALVVLRPLEDALAARDSIIAVIKGYAMNNDGGEKAGYAAPGIRGQSDVIREAQRDAGITAEDIGYIEAHGTATPLGDPIEIAALTRAFRETTSRRQFCKIGTAKTHVGHLDIAAGVTGLIKAALTVRHGIIPPLLHFQKPNPRIDFDSSPFVPATQLEKWTTENNAPRRAGVSAFGVGGTNVHMVLEQAPDEQGTVSQGTLFTERFFPVSASSPEALRGNLEALAAYAEKNPDLCLDSVAAALQRGRRQYPFRAVIQAGSIASLVENARRHDAKPVKAGSCREVIFLFPGQGSQHPGMAENLYQREPVFRAALDQCAGMIREVSGTDLIALLFPPDTEMKEAAGQLRHTSVAQPAIFAIEYALAQQWKHWGVTPACMIGHSIGEFAAACIAGVVSLRDALGLICERGRLMGGLPGGWMLSVRASGEEIAPFLTAKVNLAAINGARACVIAGPPEEAARTEQALAAAGLEFKRLHTSHAFHSSMMDPILDEFELEIRKVGLRAPSIPILSTVTGDWLQEKEATDPRYWASHLRQTVRFYDGIRQFWKENGPVFLEAGPGCVLATLASQNPDRKAAQPALSSLPHPSSSDSSHRHIRQTLGQLWSHGFPLNWDLVEERKQGRAKISGLNYAFQRERYFFTPAPKPSAPVPEASPAWLPAPLFFPPPPIFPLSVPEPPPQPDFPTTSMNPTASAPTVENALKEVLSELSGIDPGELESQASFLEQGFDSLLLTQAGKEIQDTFGVKVTLRQLIDEFSTISSLARFLEKNADPAKFGAASVSAPAPVAQGPATAAAPSVPALHQMPPGHPNYGYGLPMIPPHPMQMAYYPGYPQPMMMPWPYQVPPGYYPHPMPAQPMPQPAPATTPAEQPAAEKKIEEPVPAPTASVSGPATVIERNTDQNDLTPRQRDHLNDLIGRYTRKTATSKALTQKYRKCHADPRTVSGFNRAWKEMVYQIVTTQSKGSRLLDVDGNEYIDILNGFGPGFLGHSTGFLVEAIEKQLHQGYEVGPQCLLAMEAAQLFCEVTGNERASFVCTGSEAVQAAMRLARTVTKRDKIVIFARDYHGNFDEVLVRGVNGNGSLKSLPSAPGIPKSAAGNMIVLPYGTEESLEVIRKMAGELAAVIVEPVQSRRPEFRPRDFIREVREITLRSGTLFIFDEVVTGFRFGPRGAQEFYGIDADLCTYGKVIGGGMPLGVVSGKSQYMDTFDGGMWQYGDDSFPEHPVTFFAGTFVRHPLVMASVKAMLEFFKSQPAHFWHQVNAKGDRLAGTVHQFFASHGIPMEMPNCGSLMFVRMGENQKYGNLFFYHLREKGVFMLEGFPCYMTAAHSDEDIDYLIAAFQESAFEMQEAGFFDKSIAFSRYRGPSLLGPPPLVSQKTEPAAETGQIASPVTDDRAKKFLAPLTVPTTEPQREILVACRLDERASCAFNESASLVLTGQLDVGALESAFAELVQRHDVLRATFSEDGLNMTVHPEIAIPVEKFDLRDAPKDRLAAQLHIDASTPYDLRKGPLIRPMLFQTGPDEHHFVISAHHLACDGWSYNVIAEELCQLYNAARKGEKARLQSAKQYVDHSRECEMRGAGEEHGRQERYWLGQFANLPEPIDLPLDRPYSLSRTYEGSTYSKRIERDLYLAVKKAGARHGSTLYSTLCAAYQLLFHRLTGQDDIVVCIPAAGQNDGADTENLVGHCVNFLPLRSLYDKSEGFDAFLRKSRQTLLSATDNRSYTYGELIRKLNIPRDPRRMPLLELAFNAERMDYFGQWDGLKVLFEPNGKTHVHYTLFMNIVESDDGLLIDVDYNTEILDEATVAAWTGYFEEILREIAGDPSRKVSQMALISPSRRKMILEEWSQPSAEPFPQSTVHALFEDQVRLDPFAPALLCQDRTLSYGDLNRQASAVAACLVSRGVKPGDFVALMAHRSPETVAALLGILKAGAAYVPVDPSYPEDRIRYMLSDSSAALLLLGDGIENSNFESRISCENLRDAIQFEGGGDFQSVEGTPESVAYVIYTSGSTGQPKGTLIPHRGIVRLVRNTSYTDFGKDQVFLLSAPISFDASTLELWGPLLNGGKLAFPPAGAPSLSGIAESIRRYGVTTLWLTSGLFSLMVDECPQALRGLKQLLAGGDVLSRDHAAKALTLLGTTGRLINGYGPTENTTFTCCHTIAEADTRRISIPIGRPISHTSCYILDEAMQPVPPRVRGRLYIGGAGLSLAYLNKPDLTREKFVPHPFSPGEVLYDSGDECRWHVDGTIEFIGRCDRQVKLRGFRIEPGEIESALMRHPGVEKAVVRVTGSDSADKQLIACIVPKVKSRPAGESELRDFLAGQLPAYMIPSRILSIESLPVTANGKIDYRALPEPTQGCGNSNFEIRISCEEPATETEKRLLAIWDQVLHCGKIGVNTSFFDLGGHSLAGLKMLTLVHREMGKDLPLAILFHATTIRQLAAKIDQDRPRPQVEFVTRITQGVGATPLFLIHGGDGGTLFYKPLTDAIQERFPEIYTIEAPMSVNRDLFRTEGSIEATAALYCESIKPLCGNRKPAIAGYSFGGVVALEMARILENEYPGVDRLILLDTNNPANESKFKNDVYQWLKRGWTKHPHESLPERLRRVAASFRTRLKNRIELFRAKHLIKRSLQTHQEMDAKTRAAFINQLHLDLMNAYTPGKFVGKAFLLRASASRFSFDETMGWGELIPRLEVADISGPHLEIFDEPHIRVLIERFNDLFPEDA